MAESLAINGIDDSPRGRLLSAAAHLFRDKGFDRTTVRDIAASVGIQSGSIFHHFKSKRAPHNFEVLNHHSFLFLCGLYGFRYKIFGLCHCQKELIAGFIAHSVNHQVHPGSVAIIGY